MSDWQLVEEFALIVQNYRKIEIKNKRHKQVCHCLLNIYKLVVNSISWESNFWTSLFPMLERHTIDYPLSSRCPTFKTLLSLIILPRPETAAPLFSRTLLSLSKNQPPLFEQTAFNPKPYLFTWRFWQIELRLRHVCSRKDWGTPDASGHCKFRRNSGAQCIVARY